ncbi:MAG: hypothetical protein ABSE95_16135 [Thermodesulfobacteriota bacterium]|jgi:hypothetical protein
MTSHIPNHKEQMVRYYGFYGNFSRGLRQIENQDALIPFPFIEIFSKPPHLIEGRIA